MRYFVHDFLFEEISTNKIPGCFFYHVTVYCTNKEEWVEEDNEEFYLSVGNLQGKAHHLQIIQEVCVNNGQTYFINGPILVLSSNDQNEIITILTKKIQAVGGISKSELLHKLSLFLEWEYSSNDSVIRKIFT